MQADMVLEDQRVLHLDLKASGGTVLYSLQAGNHHLLWAQPELGEDLKAYAYPHHDTLFQQGHINSSKA